MNEQTNGTNAGIISSDRSRVTVRVIRTDEELMIANATCGVLDQKGFDALHENGCRIVAAHRQHILAGDPGMDVAAAQDRVDGLLQIFRMAFLHHQHRLLAEPLSKLVSKGAHALLRTADIQGVRRHGAMIGRATR